MASDVDTSEDVSSKRIKLSNDSKLDPVAEDLSSHARITSLEDFKLKNILSDNAYSKAVFLEGSFEPVDDTAVILLEKLPFVKDSVDKLLNNADLALNLKSNSAPAPNIIHYACYPKVDRGDIKATIIYPATQKHVEKYKFQNAYIVNETSEVYESIVQPHILSQEFSLQWIHNILEHKSEVERIVFEDPDPEIGFILVPDLKWDESISDYIYLIAIPHKKNIKSLRDLTASHLPLLNNIRSKSLVAISKKYNIPEEKLVAYFHYQPSFYHMHVHFNCLEKPMQGSQCGKAHLLDTVIGNLELCSTYYQQTTLTYTLKENDSLFSKLREASVICS
ncbi:m7GpppX diphosphatase-like [Stegodyphus dumicola]|uniref:m7GpppX diphosphatase-like n=1 Tax=Stegodyphus dumicola TaxID=202533 RepID=UPI0015B0EE9E|nr:m7GpppX diphosphatase-like [Stegodyphus dumicola]